MYKVFYNDRIVFFVENDFNFQLKGKNVSVNQYINKEKLNVEITEFLKSTYTILYIKCENLELAFKEYSKLYTIIEAAGGVVANRNNETLFIFRRNKWDLPKGKIEINEEREVAAIREVEEECGISNVELLEPLITTYHTYQLKGIEILKPTYWYKMNYSGNEKPVPQSEEEITESCWLDKSEMKKVIENTFPSIIDVLKKAVLIN